MYKTTQHNIALCYVRLSYTKNSEDFTSIERQKENIRQACARYNWTPEWYEDADGHKSAMAESNRPAWLRLKARISSEDVVVIVVNDQSRLMRNASLSLSLFERLAQHRVKLHLASQDQTLDFTQPDSMNRAYLQALLDGSIAQETSRKIRESVKHRQAKGQTLGIPPFGTVRKNGYLTPTDDGIWWVDNQIKVGRRVDIQDSNAVWRGYYECAKHILEIYVSGDYGNKRIAQIVQSKGYRFKDRYGNPRDVVADDVRRVITNWPAYAGMVGLGKSITISTEQSKTLLSDLDSSKSAVFPVELLRLVAETHQRRSKIKAQQPKSHQIFVLSDVLYCAHCGKFDPATSNSIPKTRLNGWTKQDKLRYRHSESQICIAKRDSIFAHIVEAKVRELINRLSLKHHAQLQLAASTQGNQLSSNDTETVGRELSRIQRAFDNLKAMGLAGFITSDELILELRKLQEEKAYWQANSIVVTVPYELQRVALTLTKLQNQWDNLTKSELKLLIEDVFEAIFFDLDEEVITMYILKGWASEYIEAE